MTHGQGPSLNSWSLLRGDDDGGGRLYVEPLPNREVCPVTYSIFVYGTLKKGRPNHDAYLSSSRFIGKASTSQDFMMFGCGFPLVRLPNKKDNYWFGGKIKGEVYEVSIDIIRDLDILEGHPHFYKRTITKIEEYPKSRIWMYHWNDSEGRISGERCTPTTEKFGKDKIHDW